MNKANVEKRESPDCYVAAWVDEDDQQVKIDGWLTAEEFLVEDPTPVPTGLNTRTTRLRSTSSATSGIHSTDGRRSASRAELLLLQATT